jgi:NitT/TauT family transport system ATP-binding protein
MTWQPVMTLTQGNKTFENGLVALQEVDLTINQAEFVSLVGPSGCGKSTLLKIVAGLSALSSGALVWGEGDYQPEIAFVFQEPALMPWARVKDNVQLPLRLVGIPNKKAEAMVADTLRLVGLENFKNAYPRQLSGGMKMRTSIARALVTSPQVLLMDEPFGALDDITRTKLNNDLLTLWSQQRWTVLFVTHNIYEAVYLSERVVVMAANPGRIVAEILIDEPMPRTDAFRTSLAYSHYCRQVAEALSAAMLGETVPLKRGATSG